MATPVLELVRVAASYGHDEAVLSDVSLTLAPGEILAILGPNGSGKSTLLRVLAGTLPPREGQARLDGVSLVERGRRAVARDVAFVAQSEEIRFAFSVRDVVLMGRAPHQDGWMQASKADREIVSDVLGRFDLEPLTHRPIDELSGGEKKRVALARAFAQVPRVLLLDEPTAFLDVRHQVALFDQVHGAARSRQAASVLVTHDLQLAAAHASRVVLLKSGKILADGPVDDVLTPTLLEATFEWPMAVGRFEGGTERVFAARRKTGPPSQPPPPLIDGKAAPGV